MSDAAVTAPMSTTAARLRQRTHGRQDFSSDVLERRGVGNDSGVPSSHATRAGYLWQEFGESPERRQLDQPLATTP